MIDLGLDSLMAIELKNWIKRAYDVTIQASDILDEESVFALAARIAKASSLTKAADEESPPDTNHVDPQPELSLVQSNAQLPQQLLPQQPLPQQPLPQQPLPQQPLPLLEDTLQSYLTTACSFCSDEEFTEACLAVADFKDKNGFGLQLHYRLVEKSQDPCVENWLTEIYTAGRFLRVRAPIVACQSYYGSHPFGRVPHGQAERAAIISIAAFEFKKALGCGDIKPHTLAGQVVDPSFYLWLFNACREPGKKEDRMCKYPESENEYIVVLRYGYAFKVMLTRNSKSTSFEDLKAMFEKILVETPKVMLWVGGLTTDKRDHWAEVWNSFKSMII